MSQGKIILNSLINKMTDLCQEIIKDKKIQKLLSIKQDLEKESQVMQKIQQLIKMESELMEKEKNNQAITEQELNEYDNFYKECTKDKSTNEYLACQEQIHSVVHIISDYVGLTLAKGKVPTINEVNEYYNH